MYWIPPSTRLAILWIEAIIALMKALKNSESQQAHSRLYIYDASWVLSLTHLKSMVLMKLEISVFLLLFWWQFSSIHCPSTLHFGLWLWTLLSVSHTLSVPKTLTVTVVSVVHWLTQVEWAFPLLCQKMLPEHQGEPDCHQKHIPWSLFRQAMLTRTSLISAAFVSALMTAHAHKSLNSPECVLPLNMLLLRHCACCAKCLSSRVADVVRMLLLLCVEPSLTCCPERAGAHWHFLPTQYPFMSAQGHRQTRSRPAADPHNANVSPPYARWA